MTALLTFEDYAEPARRLADALDLPCHTAEVHRFPDGEHRVRLPLPLPRHVVVCRSLHAPNDKLVELALLAGTARTHGVERLTLVAPYLCYMRQDTAFREGEAVSQRIIGRWLADMFDDVITVDPHLHRVDTLAEAVPARRAVALTAAEPLSRFLADPGLADAVLIGPDAESEQWVRSIAGRAGLPSGVARKERAGDRDVRVRLPGIDVCGRPVVLVDDMVSTGHTVAEAARKLRAAGAASVTCLITHALFAPGAEALMREAGVAHVHSCDSVPHATNAIHLAPLLAAALADPVRD